LSVREISEQTGHPKSTVHRDLAGHHKPALPVPDTASADTDDRRRAAELEAEAKRLTKLQQSERGTVPGPVIDGKALPIPGPYVSTPEREARAATILSLRKQAANLRYPTRRVS